MAVEDIGLADPRATELALNGADIYERLGSPEGELALAQAVVYMACAAKSNAVYSAYKMARRYAEENGRAPVPMHLRNAPTKLMKRSEEHTSELQSIMRISYAVLCSKKTLKQIYT